MQLTPEGTRWQPLSMTRHDVFETVQALKVWRGLRDQALTPRL